MNIYSVHMDPKTWKDPDNFRPERFLDEKGNVVGKDRTIPFGVGEFRQYQRWAHAGRPLYY